MFLEWQGECVGFVGVERHISSVGTATNSIKVCTVEREEATSCLPER